MREPDKNGFDGKSGRGPVGEHHEGSGGNFRGGLDTIERNEKIYASSIVLP